MGVQHRPFQNPVGATPCVARFYFEKTLNAACNAALQPHAMRHYGRMQCKRRMQCGTTAECNANAACNAALRAHAMQTPHAMRHYAWLFAELGFCRGAFLGIRLVAEHDAIASLFFRFVKPCVGCLNQFVNRLSVFRIACHSA